MRKRENPHHFYLGNCSTWKCLPMGWRRANSGFVQSGDGATTTKMKPEGLQNDVKTHEPRPEVSQTNSRAAFRNKATAAALILLRLQSFRNAACFQDIVNILLRLTHKDFKRTSTEPKSNAAKQGHTRGLHLG